MILMTVMNITPELIREYTRGKNCAKCGTEIGQHNKYCTKKCYDEHNE